MNPKIEPTDTIQTLLRKWAIHCASHQSPTIAMQGEWMICPSCAIAYAKQAAILILQTTNGGD